MFLTARAGSELRRSVSPERAIAFFGTDISERAVERARGEAARLGQDVAFGVADFRDLDSVDGTFDVVISCDNSVPHLLDLQELETALRAMSRKLRPGGLLLISIRDYDQALVDRASSTSRLIEGLPRRVDLRVYDWETDCPVHTVHVLLLSESVRAGRLATTMFAIALSHAHTLGADPGR